jgi:hypothetical protein
LFSWFYFYVAHFTDTQEGNRLQFEQQCQGFGLLTVPENMKMPLAALVPDNSTLLIEKFEGTWLFSGDLLPKPQIVPSHPFDRVGVPQHAPSAEEMTMRREQHAEAMRMAHAHHLDQMRAREEEEDEEFKRAIALSLAGSGGGGYDDDEYPYELVSMQFLFF